MKSITPGFESPAGQLDLDASSKMTRSPKAGEAVAETKVWNTKNLGLRLGSDFIAGFSAATMVAPIITIIDKFVASIGDGLIARTDRM